MRPISISEPAEAAAREAFLSRYERAIGHRDPLPAELAASNIPFPVDHRSILLRRGEVGAPDSVDVVLPVHNDLGAVHKSLWSLLEKTGYPFHLILVNDSGDEQTTEYLGDFAARNEGVTLIHNQVPPRGYTLAANMGLRASEADYVVLLKGGTVVTHGWLERIIACAKSDQSLGVIGAVGNSLPDWLTPDTMAFFVNSLSERARPRVPLVNGSCCVIKRAVIEAIGVLDAERFAEGHSEDADFSYRAAQAGFELAVADDAYVYNAGSSSGDPDARRSVAKAHQRALLSKHGEDQIRRLGAELEANQTLSRLESAVGALTADRSKFEDEARAILTEPLRVTFVLTGISERSSEGIDAIHQAVSGMRALGIPARIGVPAESLHRVEKSYEDPADTFFPFREQEELAEETADSDVIVGTDFRSVSMVEQLRRRRGDFLPAYHIQDYEPFFAEPRSETPGEAEASYTAIEDQVLLASSHWICGLVGKLHGLQVNKVEPSLDRALFRAEPREREESDPVRVTAMIRPDAPHSQPLRTLRLLERLKQDFPDEVEVITFGCEPGEIGAGNGSGRDWLEHLGSVSRTDLPSVLARSDVFLDCSVHQALGRTGLEAMASGGTAVLPRLGGASEYAVDDVNAVLVDTSDEDLVYRALADLVTDRGRLDRLQAGAAEAARGFSVTRSALSEYALFEYEHNRLLGDGAPRPERRDSGSS